MRHDAASFHRDRTVFRAVCPLCGISSGDALGRAVAGRLDDTARGKFAHRVAGARGRKLSVLGAVLRRAAGFYLRPRAYRQRQIRSRGHAVTAAAKLGDTGWLRHGAVARLLAVLDSDGEEARVVGGAVRNALLELAIDEIDLATTAVPDEVF